MRKITRIDGAEPVHGYLLPLDEDRYYSPNGILVGVIALADGRWSTEHHADFVARGRDVVGRRCVFDTRDEALRAAVAHYIARERRAVRGGMSSSYGPLKKTIPWALSIAPRRGKRHGLPLLDWAA